MKTVDRVLMVFVAACAAVLILAPKAHAMIDLLWWIRR